MNVKTPHRLNGTLRSEYEGADLSLSEFNALECDWRVVYQRVMTRAEDVGLYELWCNHPLTVLIDVCQSESNEQSITDWTQRLKKYYGQIAHSTPATEAARSMVEELNIGADGIKSHFDFYLSEIERSGDMNPSLAVLLLFVRNYCDVAHKFNRRLEELSRLYREKVLKVEPRGVRPDRGYVVVTSTEGEELFMLRKGCEFKSDDDLTYSLDCDSYVSPIKVVAAHTIFEDDEGVHTAPSLDGSKLFESENPNNTPMEYCWVVASDILNLSGGERRITICGVTGEELKLFTSHEEGWIEREFIFDNSQFIITVPSEDSALTPCSVDIHEVETLHPAIKFISNRAEVEIEDINIKVEVSGLTTFQLFSEIGEMDASQPFYPFGALGECGAWFSFGCEEMVGKPLSQVTLSGVWSKMPNENLSSYKAKHSERINNRWLEIATKPLFSTGDEEAELTFDLIGAKSEGYYQIKLSEPSIGFGSLYYQNLFAETMIYNARHSERKQRRVPKAPVVPMLSDVMLSYTAEQKGNCQLIRRCETFEYENVTCNSSLITNNSLVICLDNIQNQKRIRLFFDLKFYIKSRLVNYNKPITSPHWECYFFQNSNWQAMSGEQIVADETCDFTRSGAIEFDVSQICSENRLYLRAVWEGERPHHISLNNIYPNCFGVTAIGGDGTPLKRGSLNSLVEDDNRVESVTQPFDGYGGRAKESAEEAVRRTTTRIATRNRAITPLDYEALLLERFAEIDKVCCIPANNRHSEVRVVLFPKPIAKSLVTLPEWKLHRMEEYLRERISPFARVVAMRPKYELITISFVGMLHRGGVDSGDVVKRIKRKIFTFFASWYLKGTHPTLGKEYWHSSLLSRVSNDESIFRAISLIVDGAKKVEPIESENQKKKDHYYCGETQCSLLIPRQIDIELVEYNTGIDDAIIDNNFIIEQNEKK